MDIKLQEAQSVIEPKKLGFTAVDDEESKIMIK